MSPSLASRANPLADVSRQLEILRPTPRLKAFEEALGGSGLAPLTAVGIEVLQINVGRLCNQTCKHCHVDAGPDRREQMDRSTMLLCLAALERAAIPTVDITGGAPEMNPDFRWLVEEIRGRGRHVIDRCNLTILTAPGFQDLPEFLARHRVEIVASLPYYLAKQTDSQRGERVFERSIAGLQALNRLGYGQPESGLLLNLVYNPTGAYLPPRQEAMESEYKRELLKRHGIVFNRLYTITNLPINRFLEYLLASGNYESYMQRLIDAYNPAAAAGVMCRTTLSVGWDGRLHDCDFNQMLEMELFPGLPRHIRDFDSAALAGRRIATGQHCYGCTAGCGSSCSGALAKE